MSKVKKCVGKEGFQRVNYLYQVSNELATESIPCNVASTLYSNLLVNISKKTVQRIDIPIKRTICKGCRSLLLAGVTCTVRIKKKRAIWKCVKCNVEKRFDARREHVPWTQNKDSVVEILDYNPNTQSQLTENVSKINIEDRNNKDVS
ncbi:unnamed protein product [Brassicogethes aeneus]|uniref:Uncharacterized protein n=1 Tax=Brassicogethes aeneus TaxID=1431903 RepID=A0A9P0AZG2_BRAAE|nr:unnamed protein product [Brassicogethes aeneus]